MILYEVAATVKNRVCNLVTKEELNNHVGFRSYFGFPPAVAAYFRDIGAVKGAKNFPVYSDEILIDFDADPQAAEEAYNRLIGLGVGFDVYHSGGRSIHFHIPHVPYEGFHIAYSHKKLLAELGIRCDWSIYENNRLFRLPNTIHMKTFKRKTLLETVTGGIIEVPIVEPPKSSYDYTSSMDAVGDFVSEMEYLLNNPPTRGKNYHCTLFKIAAACRSGGFSPDFTRELLEKVNEDLVDVPASDSEFEKSVQNIFGSLFV